MICKRCDEKCNFIIPDYLNEQKTWQDFIMFCPKCRVVYFR